MARSSHERRPSQEKSILHHICIPNWKARKEKSADELFFASTKVWRVTADPLYSDAVVTEAHARQHNRRGFDNGPPRRPGLRMGATRPWDTIRTQYSATWAKIAFRKYYEQGAAANVPVRFHGASPTFRLSTRRHASASPTATCLELVGRAHPRRRPPPPPGGRCEAAPPPLYLVGVGLCIPPPPPPLSSTHSLLACQGSKRCVTEG